MAREAFLPHAAVAALLRVSHNLGAPIIIGPESDELVAAPPVYRGTPREPRTYRTPSIPGGVRRKMQRAQGGG